MTRPGLALAAALLAGAAQAQDVENGASLYVSHCAYCHGAGGRGDGPEAGRLNPPPRDLTVLAAENGGVFPVERIVFRIDGRNPLAAHGSPMPVFGEFFEGEDAAVKSETGQPIMTSQPVADLVAWLQSVQDDAVPPAD